jgi:hypothetical protein
MFRIVFWDVLLCKIIVERRFRGTYCLHHTRQYIPEDNSEHHTRHRENLKSHIVYKMSLKHCVCPNYKHHFEMCCRLV